MACEDALIAGLCVENAAERLVLAEAVKTNRLKTASLTFIRLSITEVEGRGGGRGGRGAGGKGGGGRAG